MAKLPGTPTLVKRPIYLNGVDTGLSAFSPNHAVASVMNILRGRGMLKVTADDLMKSHSTQKGRVDFTWPRVSA